MILLQKHITEVFILLFMIITFLLSSIEKIYDWKGNITFLNNHFKSSFLRNHISLLLSILLVLEILSTTFMIYGIINLVFFDLKNYAMIGLEISGLSLLCMLVGQRLVKDYEGASSLGIYFLINSFGIYLLN